MDQCVTAPLFPLYMCVCVVLSLSLSSLEHTHTQPLMSRNIQVAAPSGAMCRCILPSVRPSIRPSILLIDRLIVYTTTTTTTTTTSRTPPALLTRSGSYGHTMDDRFIDSFQTDERQVRYLGFIYCGDELSAYNVYLHNSWIMDTGCLYDIARPYVFYFPVSPIALGTTYCVDIDRLEYTYTLH